MSNGLDNGRPSPESANVVPRSRTRKTSVIAAAGVVGALALQWLVPKVLDATTDRVSDEMRRERPVEISVATDLFDVQRTSLAPRAYIIPLTGQEVVARAQQLDPYDPYDPAWKYEMDAVDAWYTEVQITVAGRDEAPVILQGVEVNVIDRRAPFAGVLLQEPGGDLVDIRYIAADLDPAQPKLELGSGFTEGEGEWRFPLKVSSTESEVLYIVASTDTCDCSWDARLFFTYRGEDGSIKIDNGGKPFRTSSPRNATEAYYVTVDKPGLEEAPALVD